MPNALAYFRGETVPISQAKVSVMTHALHYGTGVFEGIRGNWNQTESSMFIFRMEEHYKRFLQGCQMMMLDIPQTVDDLCNITIDLIKDCGYQQDLYIRPLAYKSQELVANLKLQEVESDFTLIVVPFGDYLETDGALKCCTSSWRRVDDTIVPPRVKISGTYVNSILAKTEATLAGFDEAIMLTQDGFISEGSGENLFMINDGILYTPPVSDNNLTGITRDSAITIATQELDSKVVERRIDNRTIGSGKTGPITQQINDVYQKAIRGENSHYIHWCTNVSI